MPSVYGLRVPDDRFDTMNILLDACTKAGITPPSEVTAYFEGYPTRQEEQRVRITVNAWRETSEWGESGVQFKVADLPEGVTIIRVVDDLN
jgi:hypothetical protein